MSANIMALVAMALLFDDDDQTVETGS